jgi:hypothetical protein
MYTPTLGRFLSRDPLQEDIDLLSDNNWFGRRLDSLIDEPMADGDRLATRGLASLNFYRYAANNPSVNIDPSGLDFVPAGPMPPAFFCFLGLPPDRPRKKSCDLAAGYPREEKRGEGCDAKKDEKRFRAKGKNYCLKCKGECPDIKLPCKAGYFEVLGGFRCYCAEPPKPKPTPIACQCAAGPTIAS